ncbi:VOC family protein [Lichenicoccus sp.]|uniref:VOC family protein n=1 Tax=Lichenicoccus sp. TaxID=2781899 RepID=UPI003D0DBB9E
MNQITTLSTVYHARRPGVLGVHSLDHFALSVPDLAVARDYYQSFGLDVREHGNRLELRTFGSDHIWGRLSEGGRKAIGHVSFGCYADDIDRFRQRLEELGVVRLDPPPDQETNGLWFRDPHGQLVEIRVAEKVMPDSKAPIVGIDVAAGQRGAPMRGTTGPVQPRRLAHALCFSPDVAGSIRFYAAALGLRLSDHPGPVAFMHGPHGSDHHLMAFAMSSDGIGYHHSAWDVSSINEVGLGAMQMADRGHRRGWGLGRHVLGSNFFHYVRDPWGSYAEYSFDIDYVPVDQEWEASYPAPENSLYLWGPDAPSDFIVNHEAIR